MRQRQRERQKSNRFRLENNFARASRFCLHFVAVVARYNVKVPKFTFLSRTGTQDNFVFLFLNFDTAVTPYIGFQQTPLEFKAKNICTK